MLYSPTMKKHLLSIPIGFLLLLYVSPSLAKSIWLECGKDKFNLDDDKREYSTTMGNRIIQGSAVFFPTQIDFSVPLFTYKDGLGGIRYDYSINRKTLEYQMKVMSRIVYTSTSFDSGWVQQKGEHSFTTGTCKIIKNPTEGNKI
jgi:hypothetical protein